jgi:hypothetical protein
LAGGGARGAHGWAARLYAAAAALHEAIGAPRPPNERADHDRDLARRNLAARRAVLVGTALSPAEPRRKADLLMAPPDCAPESVADLRPDA